MYRLVASPFLRIGWAVAIMGYRIYPHGDASTQVHDVELALQELKFRYPDLAKTHIALIGHSSGGHVAFLTIVERLRRQLEYKRTMESLHPGDALERLEQWKSSLLPINLCIGISGPYCISRHFDFEAGRGVEQLSPMKPANGDSREMFRRYSPAIQAEDLFAQCASLEERQYLKDSFPSMTFIHGLDDATVPNSSTERAVQQLSSAGVSNCNGIYLKGTGHEEAVLQLMLGGETQDVVVNCLRQSTS